MAYDFEIVYKKGKENGAADALSRMPSYELSCLALSSISYVLYQEVLASYERDVGIQKIIVELQLDSKSHKSFTFMQGQLRRKGRLVVGKDVNLQLQLLELFHSSGLGGHSGIHATYQRLSAILYWKGLWKSVREFVRNCAVCQ